MGFSFHELLFDQLFLLFYELAHLLFEIGIAVFVAVDFRLQFQALILLLAQLVHYLVDFQKFLL